MLITTHKTSPSSSSWWQWRAATRAWRCPYYRTRYGSSSSPAGVSWTSPSSPRLHPSFLRPGRCGKPRTRGSLTYCRADPTGAPLVAGLPRGCPVGESASSSCVPCSTWRRPSTHSGCSGSPGWPSAARRLARAAWRRSGSTGPRRSRRTGGGLASCPRQCL